MESIKQELLFELSNGQSIAAGIQHNPPGYNGMVTAVLNHKDVHEPKFYRYVAAETNSTPSMVFSQVLEVVRRDCADAGADVRIIAVNNPTGCNLLSIQAQKEQVGDGVAVTVQDGPSA